MAGDPLIFQATAAPGNMRNSFTGIRMTFPNVDVHVVIRESIFPFRKELCRRSEFQSEVTWREALVLFCHEYLQNISNQIKRYTYRPVLSAESPLEERRKTQRDFIQAANLSTTLLEDLLTDGIPSHRDQLLSPATPFTHTITMDPSGNDVDWPQPTPGRYPDSKARVLMFGLDRLTVEMTNSPSADNFSMINPEDAASWQAWLVDMYALVTRAGTTQTPYVPTGIERSQYDTLWNADGSLDTPIADGSAQMGDHPNSSLKAAATRARR